MTTTGVTAALTAPFLMALGFVIWDVYWKKGGGSAFALNCFKCNLASIGFLILASTARDAPFSSSIYTTNSVGYLILSSIIGILIGDNVWLEALRLIGAQRVIIIDTAKPFIAALLGWAILGEDIRGAAFGGIAVTVVGVLIVSLEKERINETKKVDLSAAHTTIATRDNDNEKGVSTENKYTVSTNVIDLDTSTFSDNAATPDATDKMQFSSSNLYRGYFFALVNVILDTYASLLTKQHGEMYNTWEINLIRFGFSGVVTLLVSLLMRVHEHFWTENVDEKSTSDAVAWYKMPRLSKLAWGKISTGVLFVTFLCPALSNYALFQLTLALALTLTSITPLYALPLVWVFKQERPTTRGYIGAIIAVVGIIILSVFGVKNND